MGNTITQIEDGTDGATGGAECQSCMNGYIGSRHVENLKRDLGHLLPVWLGVQRSFGEEDGVFLRSGTGLAEGEMPDLFHVIPVSCDTFLDGMAEGECIGRGLGFVALLEVRKRVLLPSGHGYVPEVVSLPTMHTMMPGRCEWPTMSLMPPRSLALGMVVCDI